MLLSLSSQPPLARLKDAIAVPKGLKYGDQQSQHDYSASSTASLAVLASEVRKPCCLGCNRSHNFKHCAYAVKRVPAKAGILRPVRSYPWLVLAHGSAMGQDALIPTQDWQQ